MDMGYIGQVKWKQKHARRSRNITKRRKDKIFENKIMTMNIREVGWLYYMVVQPYGTKKKMTVIDELQSEVDKQNRVVIVGGLEPESRQQE